MCVFPRLTEGETIGTAKPLDRNGWTVIKEKTAWTNMSKGRADDDVHSAAA